MVTKTRREPTPEQKAKAEARRSQMRKLAQTVSAMSEADRIKIASKIGIVTIEGRPLSVFNQCFLVQQRETVSIVGGFNQWRAAGRMVRKGEHGLAIWIPTRIGKDGDESDESELEDGRPHFIMGTVFDISQTDENERE